MWSALGYGNGLWSTGSSLGLGLSRVVVGCGNKIEKKRKNYGLEEEEVSRDCARVSGGGGGGSGGLCGGDGEWHSGGDGEWHSGGGGEFIFVCISFLLGLVLVPALSPTTISGDMSPGKVTEFVV
ncbi:hypothetical protein Tco_1462731 [Tanacetum coccineum]